MGNLYVNGKFLSQKMSGVQRYASELLRAYITLDPSVKIIAATGASEMQWYNLPGTVIQTGGKAGIVWEQLKLPLYMAGKKDALLLNLCNVAPVLYSNKVTCIHDIAFARYPQFFSKSFRIYYQAIMPWIIRSSRHIITVSEFSREELINYYGLTPDRISVIPNAGFQPMNENLILPRPLQEPYFLFVGSADPRKNLLLLLKAYTEGRLQHTHLVIAGGGYKSFNNELLQQLEIFKTNSTIHFTGIISNERLAAYYQHAKAVVVPSVYEGFGLPVAEGLSAGCQVIASDIPIFREVAGEHAFYFNSKEVLIEMLLAFDKQDKRFNDDGKRYISRKYSWKQSAECLHNTVRQLH